MVQVRRMCPFTLQNIAKKGSWPSSAKSDAAADDCHVSRQPMKNLDVIVFCCFRGKAKAIWKKTPPCSAELIVKADCWATSLHESLIITLFTLSVDLICSLLADFSALLRLYSVWLTDFSPVWGFLFFFSSQHPSWLSTAACAWRSQHGATPAINRFFFFFNRSKHIWNHTQPGFTCKVSICVFQPHRWNSDAKIWLYFLPFLPVKRRTVCMQI